MLSNRLSHKHYSSNAKPWEPNLYGLRFIILLFPFLYFGFFPPFLLSAICRSNFRREAESQFDVVPIYSVFVLFFCFILLAIYLGAKLSWTTSEPFIEFILSAWQHVVDRAGPNDE